MVAEPVKDSPRLAYLTYVPEGEGIMVGRPDTGDYALFPTEGAEAVRRLAEGEPLAQVEAWFAAATGTPLDSGDLLATLEDLGFLVGPGESTGPPVVSGRRLGELAFSLPAWCLYVASTVAAAVLLWLHPDLRPSYRQLFFTDHLAVLPIAIAVAQPPLMILHEAFHALAGRRLGLPSRFSIGRRLYFVVAETQLNAVYSVPRRRRYLPFFAGLICDVVVFSWFTIGAELLRAGGGPGWLSTYLLALAVTVVMRIIWQACFFLETDLYFVISTACGCVDLQSAARVRLTGWWLRIRGREVADFGPEWAPEDVIASRWYAPLLFVGLCAMGVNLAFFVVPSIVRLATILGTRLIAIDHTPLSQVLDSAIFLTLALLQIVLVVWLKLRERQPPGDTSPTGVS